MISVEISEVYFYGIFRPPNLEERSWYANFQHRRYFRHKITSARSEWRHGHKEFWSMCSHYAYIRYSNVFRNILWKKLNSIIYYSLIFSRKCVDIQYHTEQYSWINKICLDKQILMKVNRMSNYCNWIFWLRNQNI